MDIKEIETLIKLVSGSELTEFELEEGNMKVTLKKEKEVMVVSGASAGCSPGTHTGSGSADRRASSARFPEKPRIRLCSGNRMKS